MDTRALRGAVLSVACVLKSGGVYGGRYVANLAAAVARHLQQPYRFVCLTDVPEVLPQGIETAPLVHGWSGWWSKMELFRPDLFRGERVLFFDLDTLIVDDLSDIAAVEGVTLLRDFYRPEGLQSSVMMLPEAERGRIWGAFIRDPDGIICEFKAGGDQRFLERVIPYAERWQDVFPGQIVSYKPIPGGPHLQGTPDGARVVCFHGKPKPHELNNWTREYWR